MAMRITAGQVASQLEFDNDTARPLTALTPMASYSA
jgi:hypothetical protein